jgi:RNA polymerase sigma-70 factor (ECF subfamily)
VWGVSDEALLAGMASGDPDAAAAFVRRYQSRVYGLALTILGDPGDAEETAQEVFVRAWKHAEVYEPARGAVAPWLLTIARNAAIDARRVRRAVPVDPSALLFLELPVDESGPEERGLGAGDGYRVRAAIAALPAEQGRALVLAALFGRTAGEISVIEQAPLGTIKTRIRTAMLKLRSQLEVNDQ